MSRSYRKTPITGVSTAESDKDFKKAEHKRERRKLKAMNLTDATPLDPKTYGNVWASEKDGKQWIDPEKSPKLMWK